MNGSFLFKTFILKLLLLLLLLLSFYLFFIQRVRLSFTTGSSVGSATPTGNQISSR